MNRVKNFTAAVLMAVLGTGMVVAQDLSEVFENDNGRHDIRLEEVNGTVYRLVYPVQNKGVVFVKIYNRDNQLIYSDRIKNMSGFTRPYDFAGLPDGQYKFRIWTEAGTIKRNLVHRNPVNRLDVAVEETRNPESYKLIVKGVTREPLYVDIYNENEELVFGEMLDVDKDFSRVYSFRQGVDNPVFIVTQRNNSVSRKAK